MEKTISRQDKRNLIIVFCVITLLLAVPAAFLFQPWTYDELGTLANAAYLAGYDWSYTLHLAGGYYYKYGSALFYTLPYLFVKDTILLYRVLMIINGVLMGTTALSAYVICRRHLGIQKPNQALWMALLSAGVPSALLYNAYARADFVLVLTPWLVLLCLLEAYRSEGKRKIIFSVLCALAAVYAFMGHTRGIVLVIALFMVVAGARLFLRIRTLHMPAYLCATGAGLVLDRILTRFFKQALWGEFGAHHASMEGARFEDMGTLFTLKGIKVLVKTIFGWFYTAFSSTAGLACVGLIAALLLVFFALRKKRAVSDEVLLTSALSLLNYGGSVAMGIFFFYPHIYDVVAGPKTKRYDRIFYGRYHAGLLGLLCLLAVYALVVRKDLFGIRTKLASLAVFAGTFFVFCRYLSGPLVNYEYDEKQVIEVGTFYGLIKNQSHRIIAAGILGLAVFVLWLLLLRLKKLSAAAPVLLLATFLAIYSASYYSVRVEADHQNRTMAQKVYRMVRELDVDAEQFPYILLANYGRAALRGYQPLLEEYQVLTQRASRISKIDDLIYVANKGTIPKKLCPEGTPVYLVELDDYQDTKCRLYVRGENLKDDLEERGWTLTLYGGTQ